MFTDGALYPPDFGEARAGWAVAMLKQGAYHVAYGPVWAPNLQTAPSGEWSAMNGTAQMVVGPSKVRADCMAMLLTVKQSWEKQASPQHIHAGYAREILQAEGWRHISDIEHVKSHQQLIDLEGMPCTGQGATTRPTMWPRWGPKWV